MRARIFVISFALVVAQFSVMSSGLAQSSATIERGKYLVEGVGVCNDCHTPRNDRGEFDRARLLQGTILEFASIKPIPGWAKTSPPLAGLSRFSERHVVTVLETGARPDGKPPAPPMPTYKMSHEDALAAVAYLKTLKPPAK